MNELWETVQLSWYVVLRNWTVFKKNLLANASPTVADPLFALGTIGLGLSPFLSHINGLTYSQYLAPGIAGTAILFTSFFECSYGFFFRMVSVQLFKAMLTTPIGVNEIVLSQYMWVAARTAVIATGVGFIVDLFGLLPNRFSIVLFPFIAVLLSIPCSAMGLLAACYVRNSFQFQAVYSFLIAPIYLISGIFYPVDNIAVISSVVHLSPFYHGVKLLQMVAWNQFALPEMLYHVAVILLFSVVLTIWSRKLIRKKLVT